MSNKPIRRIAIIGTGVIGASWTALFLAKGLEVVATDVAPDAETALRRFVKAAWPALERLGLAPGASQSRLTFTADIFNLFNQQAAILTDDVYTIDLAPAIVNGNTSDLKFAKNVSGAPIGKNPGFGQALKYQAPINGRLGVRLTF